jgi:hypothetical protein
VNAGVQGRPTLYTGSPFVVTVVVAISAMRASR